MNILVTGGAGFIGSEVVRQLMERGDTVVSMDNYTQGHAKAIPEPCRKRGDICYAKQVDAYIDWDWGAVIHLAALVAVSDSVINPGAYWYANVCGTLNVLHAMVAYGVKNLVFASSAAVYGDQEGAMTEDSPLLSENPYGQSKAFSEKMIQSYCTAYGINATCFRFFNVGGAGEQHNPETHLIPNVVKAVRQDKPVNIFGFDYHTPDGTALRDYVHVKDIARAHVMALDKMKGFQVYNLGNGEGFTCLDVVEAVARAAKKPASVNACPRRPGDIPGLVADYSKAERELGWKPLFDLNAIAQDAWDFGGYDD